MPPHEGKAADQSGEAKAGELEAGDERVYVQAGDIHE